MVVVDYNRGKCAVGLSGRMITYSTLHRRTPKWYIKLPLELLLNRSISNAMILYKYATKTKIEVSDFRMALAPYTVPFTRAVKYIYSTKIATRNAEERRASVPSTKILQSML